MASLYTRFRARGLNLENAARTCSGRVESIDVDCALPCGEIWALIRLLFLQVLADRA